MVKLVKNIDF